MLLSLSITNCVPTNKTGHESYKTYSEKVEDGKLIDNIRRNLRTNPTIPEHLIHLSIDRHIVQLSGFVPTYSQAELAVLSVRNTPGVKDVIDNISCILSDTDYAKRRGNAEANAKRR